MRNEAGRVLAVVREMLAPVSTTPSPQRIKLDKVLRDLEQAIAKHDVEQADRFLSGEK